MIVKRSELLDLDGWHEEKWIENGDTRTLDEFMDEDVVLRSGFEFLLGAAKAQAPPPRLGGLPQT